MRTKKDLEEQLQREQDRLDAMFNEKQALEHRLAIFEDNDIHVWEANTDEDSEDPECLCIGGLPEPFGLNLYKNDDGKVIGFIVTDDTEIAFIGGYASAEVMMREIELAKKYG